MKIGDGRKTLLRVVLMLLGALALAEAASAQGLVRPAPASWAAEPRRITEGAIHAGDILGARVRNAAADMAVTCGGRSVENLQIAADSESPGISMIQFVLGSVEPGFASCKLRSAGVEVSTAPIFIMDAAGTLTDRLSGQALYQKVEVTDHGLDLEQTSMRPIRNVRIEVFDVTAQRVISVSDADSNGTFIVAVPPDATDLQIRAVSRLRSLDLKVADNTNSNPNPFYSISSADIDMRARPLSVQIADKGRRSGAFNILEQVQRANDFARAADPLILPIPFTIFWSERNQNKFGSIREGMIGTTYFSLTGNTAFVLGDRNTDSDEFDDSVLIHEYAHMLAARFSRDDSIGGAHHAGDNLDPRVAWSEGWANFFSAAVRNDPIYRDSSGPGGGNVLRFDLEENYPPGSWTGYGSETSVQALLWDFYDDKSEMGDSTRLDFSQIWSAFTDLSINRFVYLPYYLDHLIARNPETSDSIQMMAQAQAIDFQPGVIPSVSNPFPSYIALNSTRSGELDSLITKRTNLAQSAHFFNFVSNGGPVTIQLQVAPGTLNNPYANDLDLYVYDANGRPLIKSNYGLNGQGEWIPYVLLPAGAYVIEVRSYFVNAKGATIFNSGRYTLRLFGQ